MRRSAWYWRYRYGHKNDSQWEFLCYGRPDCFFLQMEYLEIKT